jgi:hypothetical protein
MRPAWMKLIAALAIAGALAAAWRYTPLADYLTAERVGAWAPPPFWACCHAVPASVA